MLQVNDPTGSYGFTYDNMRRLIGTTTQYTFLPDTPLTNSYSYDADSNAGYTHDANGNTVSKTVSSGSLARRSSSEPKSRLGRLLSLIGHAS
jgi:hypothetical protein